MANELLDDEGVPLPPDLQASVVNDPRQKFVNVAVADHYADDDYVPAPPELDEQTLARYAGKDQQQIADDMDAVQLNGFADYMAAQFQIGKEDVDEGIAFSAALAGLRSYEDTETKVKEARKKAAILGKSVSMWEAENFWSPPTPSTPNTPKWRQESAKYIASFIQGIPGAVARSAAFSGGVFAGGLAGAGSGFLAGGIPGAAIGFGVGSFSLSGQIMGGQSFRDLRRAGVKETPARTLALVSGFIQALIEKLQITQLLKMGKREFDFMIRTDGIKQSVTGVALRFLNDNNLEATEEALQEWTQIGTEFLGELSVEGKLRLPTAEEFKAAWTRAGKAYEGGLQGAIGQTSTAKTVGATTGVIMKGAEKVFAKNKEMTPTTAKDALVEELKEAQQPGSTEQTVVTGQVIENATVEDSEDTQTARDRLTTAEELRVKASQHLETVLYEIDQLAPDENGNVTIPKGLIEKRRDAYKDLKDARDREKKAKLTLAKSEAKDRAESSSLSKEQQEAALKEMADIERRRDETNKQIDQDNYEFVRKSLKAQIELLQKEFQKVNANDVETTHNVSKELNNAELKLQLLESGLLSKALQDQLIKKERDQILKASVGDLAFAAFVRMWRVAKQSSNIKTEQLLKDQKLLTEIVKRSGLTIDEQNQMMRFLQTGKLKSKTGITEAVLDRLNERIGELIDKREKRKARERIDNVLKRSDTGRSAPSKANIPIETQAVLSAYRGMFRESKERLEEIAGLTDEQVSTEVLEPGAVSSFMKRAIANDILTAIDKNASVQALEAMADRLEEIYKTGKVEQLERERLRQEEEKRTTASIRAAIRGTAKKIALQRINSLKRLIVMIKRLGVTGGVFNLWNTHIHTLGQHANDAQLKTLIDTLSLDKEGRARRANVSRYNRAMFKFITTREGQTKQDKKLKNAIAQGIKKKVRAGFRDPISDNELIQIYIQTQDEILAPRLRATYGMTATDLQAHVRAMLSDDQLYLAKQLKAFYQDYYNRMNEHHIKTFGYALKNNPQYSGFAQGMGQASTTYTDFLVALQFNRSILPSSTKARTQNLNKLATVDAFSNAIGLIEDVESWIAFSEKAAVLESVFNNERVQQDIIDKFGSWYLERLRRSYKLVIGLEKNKPGAIDKWLNEIRGNFGMYMAGHLGQYLKQSTGLLIYLNYMSAPALLSGFNDYINNFEEANALLQKTDFFQDRRYNATPEYKAALSGKSNSLDPDKLTVAKFLLLPVSQTDIAVNSIGMWSVYKDRLSKGFSEQEAMAEAERIAEQSQSSSGEHQKTTFELEYGTMGALASTLAKQNTQISNLASIQWRRALSNPTPANIYKALRSSLVLNGAQATFGAVSSAISIAFYALTMASDDDDEDELSKRLDGAIADFLDNILFGAHLGLPIIGAMSKAALVTMWNENYDFDRHPFMPSIPGLDAAEQLVALQRDLSRLGGDTEYPIDEADIGNLWIDFNDSVIPLVPDARTRNLIGFLPVLKALVLMHTVGNKEYEAEKKRARRKGESPGVPPIDLTGIGFDFGAAVEPTQEPEEEEQ